jgi:hypothetical protein
VIAKRPIANAVWRTGAKPKDAYHHPYWDRVQALDYDFLHGDLSQPGVHTAIVGTTKPGRWRENAALLQTGKLPHEQIASIRARWNEVADSSWVGQV